MRKNELRIGNLVNSYTGYSTKVTVVDFNVLRQHGILMPIDLTEEWLFKFGFFLERCAGFRNSEQEGRCWSYIERGNFSMNNAKGYWSHSSVYLDKNIDIKYVHQLQNLYFALTGTELELKEKI